jgi:hypothetical protein
MSRMNLNISRSYKECNTLRQFFCILSVILLIIFFVFGILSLTGIASPDSSSEEKVFTKVAAEVREPVAKERPLQIPRCVREKLNYDIYWLGIYAGEASLEAVHDKGNLRITSRAYSSSFVSVFYKVEDFAESLIKEGRPVNFKIKQHEGRYKSDKETMFDFDNRKITYFDYLKKKKKEHTIKDEAIWDVISGFYYLRYQPLKVGRAVYINIFDSNKFLKTEVYILRKEEIDISGSGKISTIVVKPELKSEGLFRKKGDIFIWLTDDEKRIPVKIKTKVPVGTVVAKLKNLEIVK